jgi:hypothetical protein
LRSCKGAELAEGMQPLSPSELVNYFGEYSICCAPASVAFANVVLPVITPKAKKVELVIRTPPTTPSAIV